MASGAAAGAAHYLIGHVIDDGERIPVLILKKPYIPASAKSLARFPGV